MSGVTTFASQVGTASKPPAITDDVYAFRIISNQFVELYSGASVSGAFPPISALKLTCVINFLGPNVTTYPPGIQLPTVANLSSDVMQWALLVAILESGTSGNSDLLLQKMKILYRQ